MKLTYNGAPWHSSDSNGIGLEKYVTVIGVDNYVAGPLACTEHDERR